MTNTKKKNNTLMIVAGAILFAYIVVYMLRSWQYIINPSSIFFVGSVVHLLSTLTISIGLLTNNKSFVVAGLSRYFYEGLEYVISNYSNLSFFYGICFLLLLIAAICYDKVSMPLSIASAVFYIVYGIIFCGGNYVNIFTRIFTDPSITSIFSFMRYIVMPPVVMILGGIGIYNNSHSNQSKTGKNHIVDSSNIIDQLTNLKNLLDENIISQDEFDEKKKKLIGA